MRCGRRKGYNASKQKGGLDEVRFPSQQPPSDWLMTEITN